MKRILSLLLVAMLALFMAVSCDGQTAGPDQGQTGGTSTPGEGNSPFVGTWRSTEKQMFQKDMASDIIYDYVYMKADEDSVIFYVPAFGSTAELPYRWSEQSNTFTVTEDDREVIASVFSTGSNYMFTWGGKVSVMEGMTGVPQMAPNSDVEIEPNMPGNGGEPGGDPDQPSEPTDPDGFLTIEKDGIYYMVSGCDPLAKAVVIPAGVSMIAANAFEGCTSLETVEIPASVISIGDSAFAGCVNLTNVFLEEGSRLSSIGRNAFSGCASLKEMEIPAGVTKIGIGAFQNCIDLASVTFAEGTTLKTLDTSIFYGCSSLSGITIPASVTRIGDSAFRGCSSLSRVTFEEGIQIDGISPGVFCGCSSLESITIPAGVTSIHACFQDCTSLTEIVLPSSLEEIQNGTFDNSGLASIVIPANVSYIGSYAFSDCTNLGSMMFEEGSKLETIEPWTFDGSTGLKSIEIPASVTELCNYAFGGCTNLVDVTFAEDAKLAKLGDDVFSNTKITDITIPEGVTSYGYWIFPNTLKSISLPENLKSTYENDPNKMSLPDGCVITWY